MKPIKPIRKVTEGNYCHIDNEINGIKYSKGDLVVHII